MSTTQRIEFFTVVLAIIAAIYVGFAVTDGRTRVLLIEVTGALVFAALALLGLWLDPWFLVLGLGGHAVWDWVHHSGRHGAAPSSEAYQHYARLLRLETDCDDVHHAMANEKVDFILLDVRSEELFEKEHVPGAISVPHWKINPKALEEYPGDSVFVVYCAGPHCNGADKAGLKLAGLNRPVKKMIGGLSGWKEEGFGTESGNPLP
jgi:rhodanese-related sulfurtransferase